VNDHHPILVIQACKRRIMPWLPDTPLRTPTGILTGMTMTTIKVPKATRDRLHRLAAADGVTLAQEIDKLVREHAPRPRPATGGFRSSRPLTAEEIDGQLAAGFGE
jgi:hypothetical protein